jgi:biopolymer transport protein ExbD
VAADGRYAVNKTAVDGKSVDAVAAALAQAANAQAAAVGRDSVLVISADATAPHQAVISVMEAARRVGLSQITFATQPSAAAR